LTRTGDRTVRRLLVVGALALAGGYSTLAAAAPTIEADLSSDVVGPGESAVFTLTVTDAIGGDLALPRFGDLQVSGPSESDQQATSIYNGRVTVRTSKVFSWTVEPPREGKFLIGPATLRHNGETFTSNTVELRCEGGTAPTARARPNARRNPFGANFPDPLDSFDDFATASDPFGRRQGEGEVFLRAEVDKTEAFLGEQVTVSLLLYSQAQVGGVQSISFPKLDGFWAEDVFHVPQRLTPEVKYIKGTAYNAYLLQKKALFALHAGELTIDPVEAQVVLGLSMFFGAGQDTMKRKSPSVKITVKPLPSESQPPGFEASNVGDFRMHAEMPSTRVSLGQPVPLKVTLEGTGNLRSVQLPRPALPPGLKTYDPTLKEEPKVSGTKWGGSKTLEWLVIPERTGTFEIPALEFAHFSPVKGTYEVARTEPIRLEVAAADGTAPVLAAPMANGGPVAASNVLSGGLRPIRLQPELRAMATGPVWERGWFWPLAAGPVAAWATLFSTGAFLGMLRRRDPEKLKVRRARGKAGKQLKTAQELLAQAKGREFHAELLRALQQFVTDKIGVPALGLTHDVLAVHLSSRGVPAAETAALVELLARCETSRFSPVPPGREDCAKALDEASRLIDTLDGIRLARPS
jgi:hypothetical protein